MKCYKCGEEIEDDSRFCESCGFNIQEFNSNKIDSDDIENINELDNKENTESEIENNSIYEVVKHNIEFIENEDIYKKNDINNNTENKNKIVEEENIALNEEIDEEKYLKDTIETENNKDIEIVESEFTEDEFTEAKIIEDEIVESLDKNIIKDEVIDKLEENNDFEDLAGEVHKKTSNSNIYLGGDCYNDLNELEDKKDNKIYENLVEDVEANVVIINDTQLEIDSKEDEDNIVDNIVSEDNKENLLNNIVIEDKARDVVESYEEVKEYEIKKYSQAHVEFDEEIVEDREIVKD